MTLRRSVRFFAIFAAAFAAVAAPALAGEPPAGALKSASLPDTGAAFVDLMAADFFESRLRLAQSRRIEADTAHRYLSLAPADRARYRAERKAQWRAMSVEDRAALRDAKTPRYSNLDETQKTTFRRIASEELGAGRLITASTEDEV